MLLGKQKRQQVSFSLTNIKGVFCISSTPFFIISTEQIAKTKKRETSL